MNWSLWSSKSPVVNWQNRFTLYIPKCVCTFVCVCVCLCIFTYTKFIYVYKIDIQNHSNKLPREAVMASKAVGVPEAFGQSIWIWGLTCRLPCGESGVGLDDPDGSLPSQSMLL